MPEFVQHHAKKQQQNKYDPTRGRRGTALRVIAEGQPGDQQQKRNVNPQLNASDANDWERPAHPSSICSGTASRATGHWEPMIFCHSERSRGISLVAWKSGKRCLDCARHDERKLDVQWKFLMWRLWAAARLDRAAPHFARWPVCTHWFLSGR